MPISLIGIWVGVHAELAVLAQVAKRHASGESWRAGRIGPRSDGCLQRPDDTEDGRSIQVPVRRIRRRSAAFRSRRDSAPDKRRREVGIAPRARGYFPRGHIAVEAPGKLLSDVIRYQPSAG